MKKLVGIAVAGALALGYQTGAMAQALPGSGSADLWLFVADPAKSTTFAEDTGIAISSIMPAYNGTTVDPRYVSGATALSGVFTANINLAPSAALSSYISSNGASNLEWAIEAVQYNSATFQYAKKPGGTIGITDNNLDSSLTSGMVLSNLETWGSSFNGDVTYIDGAYTSGGAVYAWSSGGTAGQVWGGPPGSTAAGSTNEYGQGADQSGIGLGTAATMYGVTANNGSTGLLESYILGQLELTASGTLETVGSTSAVPLPGALLLFGSGLLGLTGIGRRRSAAAAAAA